MSEEQNLVYMRGIILNAEIRLAGMIAENKLMESQGRPQKYTEKHFNALIEELGMHHSAIITQLVGR